MTGELHVKRHATWGVSDEADVRRTGLSCIRRQKTWTVRLASPRRVGQVSKLGHAQIVLSCCLPTDPIPQRQQNPDGPKCPLIKP